MIRLWTQDASASQLVAIFNALTGKNVKRFSSSTEGKKRLAVALGVTLAGNGAIDLTDEKFEAVVRRNLSIFNPVLDEDTRKELSMSDTEQAADTEATEATEATAEAEQTKTKKGKAAKAPKEPKLRGRAAKFADDQVIKVLVDNPKRAGSKSYERFALYKDGMTVGQAKEAGITLGDIDWDAKHEYISVS